MTPASTGLTSLTFVAFRNSATIPVAHHTARLAAAIAVAVVASFSAGGEEDAKREAQLTGPIASSTATGGL